MSKLCSALPFAPLFQRRPYQYQRISCVRSVNGSCNTYVMDLTFIRVKPLDLKINKLTKSLKALQNFNIVATSLQPFPRKNTEVKFPWVVVTKCLKLQDMNCSKQKAVNRSSTTRETPWKVEDANVCKTMGFAFQSNAFAIQNMNTMKRKRVELLNFI